MNLRTISFKAAFPLVAMSILGQAGSASAADFSRGQLNIASALQLDSTLTGDLPTGEGGGADNGFIDILFAPTLPDDFGMLPFVGVQDQNVSAANRILDVDSDSDGTLDGDTDLGDFGEVVAQAGNEGAFSSIVFGDRGVVKNFDTDPDQGSTISNFIEIGDFIFSVDVSTIQTSLLTAADFASELQSPNTNAEVDFDALGSVFDTSDGTSASVRYDFTTQFIFDNGDGGDPVGFDNVTAVGSVSGSIIVQQAEQVPEPATVLGLIAVSGGVLSQGLRRRKVQ